MGGINYKCCITINQNVIIIYIWIMSILLSVREFTSDVSWFILNWKDYFLVSGTKLKNVYLSQRRNIFSSSRVQWNVKYFYTTYIDSRENIKNPCRWSDQMSHATIPFWSFWVPPNNKKSFMYNININIFCQSTTSTSNT